MSCVPYHALNISVSQNAHGSNNDASLHDLQVCAMTALMGTFVSIKTMADGSPRLTLDMQCTLAQIAEMGLIPGVPFGLARITKESTISNLEPVEKTKAGELCIMACTFCKDPKFQEWCLARNENDAKNFILDQCGIDSRKELDTNEDAKKIFLRKIRAPFLEWKAEQ